MINDKTIESIHVTDLPITASRTLLTAETAANFSLDSIRGSLLGRSGEPIGDRGFINVFGKAVPRSLS